MALGYLDLPYQSHVVRYDDEKTPTDLCGKKMLPIMRHPGGVMNESLDIITLLDTENSLKTKDFIHSEDFKKLEELLNRVGEPIHSLAMPYWIWTPEFDSSSRRYFQKKKEAKRGPFRELLRNQNIFLNQLEPLLREIDENIKPFYKSTEFGLADILLASHLWGLYVVPEFQFSPKTHSWLQSVKEICRFNYHQDFLELI